MGLALALVVSTGASAQAVLQSVTVLERIEALKKVQKRLGTSSNMRVWQATLAGSNTGNVAVGIMHPSLAAYAENTSKLNGDAEGQKILDGLGDIRSILSSSLYVKP